MPRKTVTIEDLAGMVKHGFDEVIADTTVLKKKVGNIETRIENIERLLLKQHSDQIKSLESRVKRLETLYSVKFQ